MLKTLRIYARIFTDILNNNKLWFIIYTHIIKYIRWGEKYFEIH